MTFLQKHKNLIINRLLWICLLILVIRSIQVWVADVCLVPSSSMEDAILAGDRIVVCKSGNTITRNDVIVFNHPDGNGSQLVKRCMGLPGDTISLYDGVVHINGRSVATPPTVKTAIPDHPLEFPHPSLGWSMNRYGPVIVPAKGTTITIDSLNMQLYQYIIRWEDNETIPGSTHTFQTDCYFVLGDYRGNSVDSRYWGVVPGELVVGKAVMVYFSRDTEHQSIRWNRIGKKIK